MTDSFLLTLGLCRRAGFLIGGRTEVADSLQYGEITEFFVASDLSVNSLKEADRMAENSNAVMIRLKYTKEEIGNALGLKPVGIFAVKNKGMNDLLKSKSGQNEEAK